MESRHKSQASRPVPRTGRPFFERESHRHGFSGDSGSCSDSPGHFLLRERISQSLASVRRWLGVICAPPAMISRRQPGLVLAALLVSTVAGFSEVKEQTAEDTEFFTGKIQPILRDNCYECHSHESGKTKGGLTLDSRSGWSAGGGSGP